MEKQKNVGTQGVIKFFEALDNTSTNSKFDIINLFK